MLNLSDCDGNCVVNVDCSGVCGGDAVIDECGECNGNGIEDGECDCDGNIDLGCGCGEEAPSVYYQDNDGDGLGSGGGQEFCDDPGQGWVTNDDDNDACEGIVDDCGVCNGDNAADVDVAVLKMHLKCIT